MKRLTLTLIIIGCIACRRDNDPPPPPDDKKLSVDSLVMLNAGMPRSMYFDLTFIDSLTGYALSQSFIAKTTDGGLTWDSIPLPVEQHWFKIRFADALNGYIIGGDNNDGYLLKTTDAGQTWSVIDLQAPHFPYGIHFLNKDVGFITGIGFFRKTTDGGQTWTSVRPEQVSPTQYRVFDDVNFRNALEGIVSSRDVYYKTIDGGNTWDSLRYTGGGRLTSIYYVGDKVLARKSGDTVIDLHNSIVPMKLAPTVSKLLFVDDDQHCIAVGHHAVGDFHIVGEVFVTNNGWRTYANSDPAISVMGPLFCLAQISPNRAMTIGMVNASPRPIVLKW
jgi:photosystem II stability/assembly factor-like uncharacterized protein